MKRMTTILSMCAMFLVLLFSSGCQVLMLPFQLVYYILGTIVTTFFSLLPVAARCLPLLLFLAQVQDDAGPATPAIDDPATMVCQQVELQQSTAQESLSDAYTMLDQAAQGACETAPDTQLMIFSFDAWTDSRQMAAAIEEQTRGKKIVAIECRLVDGASLFNDKLTFFTLLDRLRNKGISFQGFGSMQPAAGRFYGNHDA